MKSALRFAFALGVMGWVLMLGVVVKTNQSRCRNWVKYDCRPVSLCDKYFVGEVRIAVGWGFWNYFSSSVRLPSV